MVHTTSIKHWWNISQVKGQVPEKPQVKTEWELGDGGIKLTPSAWTMATKRRGGGGGFLATAIGACPPPLYIIQGGRYITRLCLPRAASFIPTFNYDRFIISTLHAFLCPRHPAGFRPNMLSSVSLALECRWQRLNRNGWSST